MSPKKDNQEFPRVKTPSYVEFPLRYFCLDRGSLMTPLGASVCKYLPGGGHQHQA